MNTHTDLARICAAEHLDYHGEQFAPAPLVPVQEQVCLGMNKPVTDAEWHTPEITEWLHNAKRKERERRRLKNAIEEAGEDFRLRGLRGPSEPSSKNPSIH